MRLLPLFFATALLADAADFSHQEIRDLPAHSCLSAPAAVSAAAPKNIIFMIGDGMGSEQVWLGWLANRGQLNIEQLPVIGFSRTPSFSHAITDSAAGGTALACGQKTINGHLGQNEKGVRLTSLQRLAEQRGLSTGLVVTKDITDATPAAFYAHADDRGKDKEIAAYLPESGAEFVRGGGHRHFNHEQMEAMRAKGMDIRLGASGHMAPASKRGAVLPQDVAAALSVLEKNEKGFFLMVEGSQIDTACHANDLREAACEMLDFDQAIGVVLEWMQQHPDTLLVITADHQTGGLAILDADKKQGYVKAAFSTGSHNGVAVPVYAGGAGAADFGGIHENTEIYSLLKKALENRAR